MQNTNDPKTNKDLDKETLQKLKDYGIFVKGVSKAFTIFLILWYLSKEDIHGYLIMKKIDELFEPQIELGLMKKTKANKIYPLLKVLNQHKLIENYPGIHNKKEVKIYRLTEEGLKALQLIKKAYTLNIERNSWKKLISDLKS